MSDTPLVVKIEESIIKIIKKNHLEPGDKLDNEYLLAEQLNVGRSTIREAIKGLVSRNILETRQGAGTFVSEKRGISSDPLGLTFVEGGDDLTQELLDARLIIEPEIAALAAVNATEEEIEELESQCIKTEKFISEGRDYTMEDVVFHKIIAEASRNRVLGNLVPIIHSSVRLTVEVTENMLVEGTIRHHREIVNAIKRRDAIGARTAMAAHIGENRANVIEKKSKKDHTNTID